MSPASTQEANAAFERSFRQNSRMLGRRSPTRAMLAHAGKDKPARTILDGLDRPHPGRAATSLIRELRADIDAGKKVPLMVATPAEGWPRSSTVWASC